MPEVKIYSTTACPYCKLAKQFFDENKISYIDIDVSLNQMAAQEMIQKSGQLGVPVIEINGQIVIGFDKAKIKQLLGLS